MSDWTHDSLAADLASHFRGDHRKMVWEDMQMGSVGSARPDVFVMMKSYTQPKPMSYEVKTSRPDFLADVTSGKWMAYKDFSTAVFFCVPKGLVHKNEIPDGAGLMVRTDKVWRTTKRAILNDVLPDFWVMQKLLIDGIERTAQRHRNVAGSKYLSDREARKRWGDDVARIIRDTERARTHLDQLEARGKSIQSEIDEIKAAAQESAHRALSLDRQKVDQTLETMRELVGLPRGTDRWRVLEAMRKLMNSVDGPRLRNLHTKALDRIKRDLETGVRTLNSAVKDINEPGRDELGEE